MPDLSLFHFIRPWALLLIIPAAILYWFYRKQSHAQEGWAAIIDPHLLSWIMPRSDNAKGLKHLPMMLLIFWIVASIALAGPTWKKTPQPVFSSKATQVILLDLSLSMDADDIKPSRLERAKFKIKDYLKLHHEGLTGLVVYAGDGFILSPLTTDKDTIENLLGAVSTKIMPLLGSRPEAGFEHAIDLLDNTGLAQGKILWFTDGADKESLDQVTDLLDGTPYQLNILALGTEDGAPIKLSDEEGFLKDRNGNIVIPQLDYALMTSFAEEVGAVLTPVTVDNEDVQLMAQASSIHTADSAKDNTFADDWFDLGYWLIILLLPIVLLSFKHRSLLGCLCIMMFAGLTTPSVQANEASTDSEIGTVQKLFLNKDQQGKKLLDQGNSTEAYNQFQDPRWKATAAYRMGSYKAAQSLLDKIPDDALSAEDYYNQGNALALDGQYEPAIAAYEKALTMRPSHEDAQYNKDIIEQLKQEQEQQKQQDQNQEGESENQQDQEQQSQQESQQDSQQDSSDEQSESQEQQQQEQQQQPEPTPEQLEEQFKEEEKDQEMEQWLKRLSDDPGGLLRRKMYREYQRRGHKQHVEENW